MRTYQVSLLAVALLLVGMPTSAAEPGRFELEGHVALAAPVGTLDDMADFGLSGGGTLGVRVNRKVMVGIEGGGVTFFSTDWLELARHDVAIERLIKHWGGFCRILLPVWESPMGSADEWTKGFDEWTKGFYLTAGAGQYRQKAAIMFGKTTVLEARDYSFGWNAGAGIYAQLVAHGKVNALGLWAGGTFHSMSLDDAESLGYKPGTRSATYVDFSAGISFAFF